MTSYDPTVDYLEMIEKLAKEIIEERIGLRTKVGIFAMHTLHLIADVRTQIDINLAFAKDSIQLKERLKSAEEALKSLDPIHAVAHFEKFGEKK